MDLVVVADTHLRAGLDGLPDEVVVALGRADAIVHAGDVVSKAALDQLRRLGTVHAVLGNNDVELAGHLPAELFLDLAGVRVAVLHDSGPARGRAARLARRHPTAQVVIFGHSHVPVNEPGIGGQLLFNPGSPTQRRAQPFPTFGRLRLEDGCVLGHAVEPLEGPSRGGRR